MIFHSNKCSIRQLLFCVFCKGREVGGGGGGGGKQISFPSSNVLKSQLSAQIFLHIPFPVIDFTNQISFPVRQIPFS